VIGRVAKLWRYPVKSMGGELCESLEIERRGVRGDRRYALRFPDGKLGSGKTTRRFRRVDGLLGFRSRFVGSAVTVVFPDGAEVRADDPAIHAALSAAWGEAVALAEENDVPHLDAAPIHVVTTASIAWLEGALPGVAIDERRFRPNLLIDAPGVGPLEAAWIGKRLRVGAVDLEVVSKTERCAMVTLPQAGLEDEPRVLRAIAQNADNGFGAYATVATRGVIRLGDPVALSD
jgi:uncharacterized protein YcbX